MYGDNLIGLRLDVETPLARARIPVPKVWLAESPARLEWDQEIVKDSPPVTGCLSAFIRLADASDRRIEVFAQRWGILGICEHGRPGMHDGCQPLGFADRSWETEEERAAWYKPGANRQEYWEPVSAWRYYARQMGAFLGIVTDLRNDLPTRPQDWATIHTVLPVDKPGPDWDANYNRPADIMDSKTWVGAVAYPGHHLFMPPEPAQQRKKIAQLISYLFQDAALTPRLVWDDGSPRVILEPTGRFARSSKSFSWRWPRNSLYSVLICQLAVAATAEIGPLRCAKCGKPDLPRSEKRPRYDRPYLCSEECRAARHREVNAASGRRRYAARRGGGTTEKA